MRKIQSEVTQKKIQDAAIEILLEKGYESATVYEIAKRSGINRTTFYMFYSSKEELVREICYSFMDWHIENLSHAVFAEENVAREIIQSDFERMKNEEKMLRMFLNIRIKDFVPELEMKDEIAKAVKEKIPERIDEGIKEYVSMDYAANVVTTVKWWLDHYTDYDTDFVFRLIYTCSERGLLRLLE